MRSSSITSHAALNVLVLAGGLEGQDPSAVAAHEVSQSQLDQWKTELSNWGRWGEEDEMGALNLVTPAKRREAAALVGDGVTVSLARDAATEEDVDNGRPYEHAMVQLDALAEAAAERSRWDFLLTASPLPMVRGTGSPINPIAVF